MPRGYKHCTSCDQLAGPRARECPSCQTPFPVTKPAPPKEPKPTTPKEPPAERNEMFTWRGKHIQRIVLTPSGVPGRILDLTEWDGEDIEKISEWASTTKNDEAEHGAYFTNEALIWWLKQKCPAKLHDKLCDAVELCVSDPYSNYGGEKNGQEKR